MSSDLHALEPFPLFVDTSMNAPSTYLSKMSSLVFINSSNASKLRQSQTSVINKFLNYFQLQYYQYEVTFGLYCLTYNEKLILNAVVLGIFTALSYATYYGLQPFIVRCLCHMIYYVGGSLNGVEELCTGTACS